MRFRWFCVVLLLAACSIEERGAPGTDPDARLDLSTGDDSITVTLTASPRVRRGDSVPIVISVKNTTARPLELALAGREIAFDIVASRGGTVTWQRLAGQTIPSILQLKKLLPGESFELMDYWRPNDAGTYQIAAKILTDADPIEPSPISVTIE